MYTTFGMPSGPGALWGLSQAITHFICAFEMVEKGNFGGGYSLSLLVCSSNSVSRKKVATNALVLSSFEAATVMCPSSCAPRVSVGTQALPLSVGAPDV